MARSITSFDIDSARALAMASLSLGFIAGSGAPCLAATVISRESLENSLERAASWRPFRCMMFLNFEWPAMVAQDQGTTCGAFYPWPTRCGTPAMRGG